MTLEYLIEASRVPKRTQLLDEIPAGKTVVSISEMESGTASFDPGNTIVVVDGYDWIAEAVNNREGFTYFSGRDEDAEGYGKYNTETQRYTWLTVIVEDDGKAYSIPRKTVNFSSYRKKEEGLGLGGQNQILNKINEEETKMSNMDNFATLDELLAQAEKEAGVTSNVFADAKPVDETKSAKDLYREGIQKKAQSAKMPNASGLHAFNKARATLIGYITQNDSKIVAGLKTTRKIGLDGQPMVKPEFANDKAVKDALAAGKAPAAKYCETEKVINLRSTAPSPVKAVVAQYPQGGLVANTTLLNPAHDVVPFDAQNTASVTVAVPVTVFQTMLAMLNGGTIKEDVRTYSESADAVTLVTRAVVNKEGKTQTKVSLKPTAKRSLVMPGAYIPVNTYETLDMRKLSAKDEDLANQSLFVSVLRGVNAKIDVTPDTLANGSVYSKSYESFSQETKDTYRVEVDPETTFGKITSPYINSGDRKPMVVAAYWDKGQTVDPVIPVKEAVRSKYKENGVELERNAFRLKKQSPLGKDPSPINCLNLPAFAGFREAAGDVLNAAKLQELTTTAREKKSKDFLSVQDLVGLIAVGDNEELVGISDNDTYETLLQELSAAI